MSSTSKVRISAMLSESIVEELKKMAKIEELSFSALLQQATENWLENQLRKDAEELSHMNFDDLPSENEWLSMSPKTV